jgi:iron complex transport system permease protein
MPIRFAPTTELAMPAPQLFARLVFAGLGCLLVLALGFALLSGPVNLSWADLRHAWSGVSVDSGSADVLVILWQLRLPRVLLAALVGAALALSGAATQGLFRNPLADPSIIGVTSGASLGASLMIAGGSLWGWWTYAPGPGVLALGAFVGGLAASALVFRLAHSDHGTSVLTMLLIGVAIGALAGACNSGLAYVVDNEALRRMSLWQMGGLSASSWSDFYWAAALMLPLLLYLPGRAAALNAMLLGESEARHLGVDVERLKRNVIVLVAITVAGAVALTGVIAFVGLVVPHVMRLLLGPDHRRLLPAVGLAGAVLLILADALARSVVAPAELPVGILTALLGAPLFLSLLRQRQLYLPV